jgi:hypothetical protein
MFVHLDFSNNNIFGKGAAYVFDFLNNNEYIYSLNISCPEGLNRNHITPKACKILAKALQNN